MSPQEQWEALKDLGPLGAIAGFVIACLNLTYLWSGKSRQDDFEKNWIRRHTDTVAELKLDFEKQLAVLKSYEDQQRHDQRDHFAGEIGLLRVELALTRKENSECADDRRKLEVKLASMQRQSPVQHS